MEKEDIFLELSQRSGLAEKVLTEAGADSMRAEIVAGVVQSVIEQLKQISDPIEAQRLAVRLKVRGVVEILAGIGVYKLSEHFLGRFGEQKEIQDVILWMVAMIGALMPVIDGIKCFSRAKQAKILSADIRDVLKKTGLKLIQGGKEE